MNTDQCVADLAAAEKESFFFVLVMSEVHSQEAQRANVFLLWKTGKKASEIHELLKVAHGDNSMSERTIRRWIEAFKAGRTALSDEKHTGRPRSSSRQRLAERIQSILADDARSTIRELADRTNSPSTSVFRVIKDDLELVRLCARWIPRLLTPEMKEARVSACEENLERVEEAGGWEHFRQLIVTGDETWVPFFDPPTKQESMVSKQESPYSRCKLIF